MYEIMHVPKLYSENRYRNLLESGIVPRDLAYDTEADMLAEVSKTMGIAEFDNSCARPDREIESEIIAS